MDKTMNERGLQLPGYARVRMECYVLLASLLKQPPAADLQNVLRDLEWDDAVPDQLANSLLALRTSSSGYPIKVLQDEFNELFVGPGGVEIVPYASWYLEKRIQSRPLADLRTDLYRLGIVRNGSDHEPEDHAAALCEIMAIISNAESHCPLETQAEIFQRHLASWMGILFQDLTRAKSAAFYRNVGRFGLYFLECESQYLECHLNLIPVIKRRTNYENRPCRQPANLS